MRRIPDRTLVIAAGIVLAIPALMLAGSTAPVVFIGAELVQGAARGMFWTGAQTHVVRSRRAAVGRLATVNFVSSFGQLAGPPLAGVLIERSYSTSLDAAAGLGLAAAVMAAAGMHRLPLFEQAGRRAGRQLWRQPGVRFGCWSGVTAGSWRGLLSSYVPVVLASAGESSAIVGVMVAVANGASIAGSGLPRLLGERGRSWLVPGSIVVTGLGVGVTGYVAGSSTLTGVALAASGVGAGMLQTLGPALAATGVPRQARGDAVAIAGSFRAGALFAAPIGTAGLLDVISLPPALAVAGVLLALPTGSLRARFATEPDLAAAASSDSG